MSNVVLNYYKDGNRLDLSLNMNHCIRTSAAKVVRSFPWLEAGEARVLADGYLTDKVQYEKARVELVNSEFERMHKKPMGFADWRISGIGREEFSKLYKEMLRKLVSAEREKYYLAQVFSYIARYRN
jgi:hypothetical protein